MIIRNGFVSNSSSSSFIVLGQSINDIPTYLEGADFVIGSDGEVDFGWERTQYRSFEDKVNFAYIQAMSVDSDIWRELIYLVLVKYGRVGSIDIGITDEWSRDLDGIRYGSIDHQSCATEGENTEIFNDEETLARFLFSSHSYIQGGNDNE